jgi:hypothetical protein
MKLMKLTVLSLAIITANSSNAEYQVRVYLDPQHINIDDYNVDGNISLSKTTINRGESSAILWNYKYANEIDIDGVGSYTQKAHSVDVSPLSNTTYTVNVKNGAKTKVEHLTLTVIQPVQNIVFDSDTYRIGYGKSAKLNWNVTNTSGVSISPLGPQSNSGAFSVSPVSDTTYTLTAAGYDGIAAKTKSLDITVIPDALIQSFTVDKINVTKGDSVNFAWNITHPEVLKFNGEVLDKSVTTKNVVMNTVGTFNFKLDVESLSGTSINDSKTLNVFDQAVISSFLVNNKETLDVSPNAALNFAWASTSTKTTKLNNDDVTGTTKTLTAETSGSKVYTLTALNGADAAVTKTVTVNVIANSVINSFTALSNVFVNDPITLNWSASGVSKYTLKSDNASSGVSTSENDLGTDTSKVVTPNSAGTYNYTLAAYNTADAKIEQSKTVVVEPLPTFTGFTVNGSNSVTVAPSAPITLAGSGFSSGAVLTGRDSSNSSTVALPSTAPATTGTFTYYAAATRTLNSVVKNSAVRSVTVIVEQTPTIESANAPSIVFANSAFTASWSGTNITSYTVSSNNASSGIPVAPKSLGSATSTTITPTVAGTYNYTITGVNSVGGSVTKTFTVTVEADPSFTSLLVNGSATASVAPGTALAFSVAGASSGAVLVGRDSSGTTDQALPTASAVSAGTTTYYGAVRKTINAVTRYSSTKNIAVTVVGAPIMGPITAPSNVFTNATFSPTWSGANVSSFTISSNNAASGIPTTPVDIGRVITYGITPTAAGTYVYTISAINAINQSASQTKTVVVEADPTLGGFLVNGSTAISVNTGTALSFTSSGLSAGAILQGRNGANDMTLPSSAITTAGTTTYSGAAKKTLNGVIRYSASRSVTVTTVVPGPVCQGDANNYWTEQEDEGTGLTLFVMWNGVTKYNNYKATNGGTVVGNDGKTYGIGPWNNNTWTYNVCKLN